MPPVPEPQVPLPRFDDSDEESLLLLRNDETKCYCDLFSTYEDSEEDSPESTLAIDQHEPNNPLLRVWEAYYNALQRRPLLIKSITAFILMGWADLIAQMVEHWRELLPSEYLVDWIRALRFAIFGLVGAPWTHYYYNWLDMVLPPTPYPWTMTTAVKVAIDQFIQAPALLALIISGMSIMQGKGIDGMKLDMRHEYVSTLIKNWQLWIPATIVNFTFVKPDLRVLYDNLIFFVWTIFLSMILNDHESDELQNEN